MENQSPRSVNRMIKVLREWGTLVTPQYVTSQCGAQKLLIDGYSFICHRVNGPRTYWRCDWCQKSKCKATVATEGGETYLKDVPHNHPRSKNVPPNRRISALLKEAVMNSDEPISDIVRRVLHEHRFDPDTHLPTTIDTMCRSMQRFRAKIRSQKRKQSVANTPGSTQHPQQAQPQPQPQQAPPPPQQQPHHQNASSIEHQPANETMPTTCTYSLMSVLEGCSAAATNADGTQQQRDQHTPAWGAMNVSADPAVTFNNIGVMDGVKAEDASDTAAMMVMGMSSELQQDGYAQCYKHEKKDEHPTTSELLCADVAQNSLIRRVIEGYHQLRCVRRTAESSVSRKSVIAMFSNSPQTSDATSEKLQVAKYDELQKYRQIEMPFLVDFVTKVFIEIAHFDSNVKVSLFREFVPCFWLAEIGYLSLNTFAADMSSSSKVLVSMWQYLDEHSMSTFFDSQDDNATRALGELLNGMLKHIIKPMSDTGFTHSEFAILIVWLLSESANQFNSNAEIDPKLCNTLAAIRESTFCAADAYYQNANVGSCAGRVASLVNIAFHIKLLRERFREAMKIVPLVNVFEADPFL